MIQPLLRFAIVGALGFLVDAGTLEALTRGVGLDPYLGRVGSFACAVTFTWALNRSFTFGRRGLPPGSFAQALAALIEEWARFVVVNLSGGFVSYGAYAAAIAVHPWFASHLFAAVGLGSAVGLVVNFSGSRALVYGAGRAGLPPAGDPALMRGTKAS